MFNFIKNSLTNIYNAISSRLTSLFSVKNIDDTTLNQLERILLEADTGARVTQQLITQLKSDTRNGLITSGEDLKAFLEQKLLNIATDKHFSEEGSIFLMVGINGSGKTTMTAKLAHKFKQQGKKVLLIAADTFRAAATQQLENWARKIGVDIVIGKDNQDPASVVYAGCQKYKDEGYSALIIDTAGRLQTKINLMKELAKIGTIIKKQLPETSIKTLLTIDAMLGQNSLDQATLFNESTHLDGIVLTKMDGTGKGGIVFAIMQELKVPVAYISFGEQMDQCKIFNAQEFVYELLNS